MKYHEVVARLKRFGVREYVSRGKGSERLLIRETVHGSVQGPQYSMKCHGEGKEVPKGTLHAALAVSAFHPKSSSNSRPVHAASCAQ